MKDVIWKEINGCNGLYLVNNLGTIKRIATYKLLKSGKIRFKSESIVKKYITHYGYNLVCINMNGVFKLKPVHRIVAESFISNPDNKRTVNHKNGIKTDNRVENLEWMTHSENHLHSFRELNRRDTCAKIWKNKFGSEHIRSKKVIQYSKKGEFITEYSGIRDAERITGINHSSISNCCRNKTKSAGGYIWRY